MVYLFIIKQVKKYTQKESNLHLRYRKPTFYPLNYGARVAKLRILLQSLNQHIEIFWIRCLHRDRVAIHQLER